MNRSDSGPYPNGTQIVTNNPQVPNRRSTIRLDAGRSHGHRCGNRRECAASITPKGWKKRRGEPEKAQQRWENEETIKR